MPKPLDQQIVVITGASSGIGRSAALQFGEAGATVVLASRNEEALSVVANLIDQSRGRSLVVPTDVGDWDQVQHLAQTVVDRFGRIDTWVNNAGVSVYATAEETEVEETQRIMQTNFMGVVHGVSAVLPIMKAQGYGQLSMSGPWSRSERCHCRLPMGHPSMLSKAILRHCGWSRCMKTVGSMSR
jgi:NADP-dependent 3-hydroxy acid dehydrogenase YdfG